MTEYLPQVQKLGVNLKLHDIFCTLDIKLLLIMRQGNREKKSRRHKNDGAPK